MALAKALRAFKQPYRNRNGGFQAGSDWSYMCLFLPVVVVSSKLYVVDGESIDPEAIEVPHVRFERALKAEKFGGTFPVDFVQRDALGEFIREKVTPFGEKMAQLAIDHPDKVVPKDKWPMWTDW